MEGIKLDALLEGVRLDRDGKLSGKSISIVQYYMGQKGRRCMWAQTLTIQDYQALVDRGWIRRSCFCYKHFMNDVYCCPAYIIKCEALQFKISKSQKKILKRMAKFLRNELHKDKMDTNEDHHNIRDIGEFSNYNKHLQQAEENISEMNVKSVNDEVNLKLMSNVLDKEKKSNNPETRQKHSENDLCASSHNEDSRVVLQSVESVEVSSNKTLCKKAKLLRIERKQNKLLAQGKTQKEIESIFKENKQQNHTKSIEELFYEIYTATNRLEVKLVRCNSELIMESSKVSYELYRKYKIIIDKVPAGMVTEEEYTIFVNKSPLQHVLPNDGPFSGYGSFHQQYWLDNKLIAVAVLDILPSCISRVFFFYDPAYYRLSLERFSYLQEICLTRKLNETAQNLKDYYMGYYIQLAKFKNKAQMRPSKLLSPITWTWIDLASFPEEKVKTTAIDQDGEVNINKVLVLYHKVAMSYESYKEQTRLIVTKEEDKEVEEYVHSVGMKCAQKMLLYRR